MKLKYLFQKFFGRLFDSPIIPAGKTVGYSLVKSEKFDFRQGEHTQIIAPYFLHHVSLGNYSYISKNSNISHCSIGKFCSIGPNFCCGLGIHPTTGISTSPMFYSTAKQNGMTLCKENKVEEFKQTVIGNDVFIGANVTVLDGITIGDGAIIGAGAVVTKDIPPYAIAVGVPAKVEKYRFDDKTITKLLQKKWWNLENNCLESIAESFWSIEDFLNK